jgi:rhamnosyl/mannosyltransferase
LVLLEAFASGLPAISTDLPGVRMVNIHGTTGLTVPCNDPHALRAAISRLTDDNELRIRLGREAERASQQYSATRMTAEMESIYAKVIFARLDHAHDSTLV